MRLFLFISLFTLSTVMQAQNDTACACCTENHRQFDFWIGSWEVFDTVGTRLGTNNIVEMYEACLLQENWVGEKGTRGTSYNYFDPSDNSWNQLWLDNQGTILKLKGGFNGTAMVMKSEANQGRYGLYINRISWEPKEDGSVIQTWDVLNTEGELLQTLFLGIYRRAK